MEIYLDNAGTTRVLNAAAEAVKDALVKDYGNPSSLNMMGARAENALRDAGECILNAAGADGFDIIFTSGATEANNQAVIGAATNRAKAGMGQILTQKTEHPSVLRAAEHLGSAGFECVYADISPLGVVSLDDILDKITDRTFLLSIMRVNNETGAINDVPAVAAAVKARFPGVLIHSDGAQSFCKLDTNLKNIDMLSLSAHKTHGPKGIGALLVRRGVRLKPLMHGGEQQNGIRPGTENMPGILGFAAAVRELSQTRAERYKHVNELKNIFIEKALKTGSVKINGGLDGSPYIASISFGGVKAEVLVNALSSEGIYISAGAACSSKKRGGTVLSEMGISKSEAEASVRVSFSHINTHEEVLACADALTRNVQMLRKSGGYK
jgi:cysteine desulfurase